MSTRGAHTDATFVRAVLDPTARTIARGPVVWARTPTSAMLGTVPVTAQGLLDEGSRLEIRVSRLRPEWVSCVFVAGGAHVRRLCVNRPHPPHRGTHKHRADHPPPGDAYEPDDIPVVPRSPSVPTTAYRDVLRAFGAECHIEFDESFEWTPPWEEER